MPTKDTSLAEVQSSFKQLSAAATSLNIISDQLGKTVSELEAALKKLNLGVSAWVTFSSDQYDDPGYYSYQQIGYAKIAGKWGIALRTVSGSHYGDNDDSIESWLFNDAPRTMRVRAINTIPELLEALTKEANALGKQTSASLEQASQLTAAINAVADKR